MCGGDGGDWRRTLDPSFCNGMRCFLCEWCRPREKMQSVCFAAAPPWQSIAHHAGVPVAAVGRLSVSPPSSADLMCSSDLKLILSALQDLEVYNCTRHGHASARHGWMVVSAHGRAVDFECGSSFLLSVLNVKRVLPPQIPSKTSTASTNTHPTFPEVYFKEQIMLSPLYCLRGCDVLSCYTS
jgi:hypothetical protein